MDVTRRVRRSWPYRGLVQQTSTPAPAPAGPRARPALPLGLLTGEALALGTLAVRDPHVAGSWGSCPFLTITGMPCPWCGGLRSVNDLVRGDLLAAVSSNAPTLLAVVAVVAGTIAWVVVAWRAARVGGADPVVIRLQEAPAGRWAAAVLLLWCAFGVARWWAPLSWWQP